MAETSTKPHRQGAPRWMVTFADLMALLFALFVLLLSFSEIDSDSFKRNAGPISEAFNVDSIVQPPSSVSIALDKGSDEETDEEAYKREVARVKFVNHLEDMMADELSKKMVELEEGAGAMTIRFPSKSTFASGSSDLSKQILPALDRVSEILAEAKGLILVAGHTDDSPISTARFHSNWDLSAARAASVVNRLIRNPQIDPRRLTAQGFAASRPLVANASPEGRAANRRVEISVEFEGKEP